MAVSNGLRRLIPGHRPTPYGDSDQTHVNLRPDDNSTPEDEPSAQTHLERLRDRLKIVHVQAGEPTYRALETLTGRRLSASTISRMFNPTRPPKWPKLEYLLHALGVPRQDCDTVWRPLWAAAVSEVSRISDPARVAEENLSPSKVDAHTSCARCGAVVADPAIHRTWHQKLSEAESVIELLTRLNRRAATTPQARSTTPVRALPNAPTARPKRRSER